MLRTSVVNTVHLIKTQDNNIVGAMERLIDKLGFPSVDGRPIGIKVNLCDYRRPETGATTDPLVLDPLLKNIRNHYPSSRIFLFENDATGTLADNLFTWLGLDKIALKYDAEIINLAREKWTTIALQGLQFKEMEVPVILWESIIINHPKMKTHGRTKISCGLKNMFGCYRIKKKDIYHKFLDEAIVDVNLAIPTHLTIVDGVLALEGNRGPTQGFPKKVGVLVGGADIVAVDSFCARFMGFNPRSVRHIAMSSKTGVGSMRFRTDTEVREQDFSKYKFQFSIPKFWLMQTLRRILK
jgi:uncharacterized protein (DUF362 family)